MAAEIVVGDQTWDADEVLHAVEKALAYVEALDEAEATRYGFREDRPSALAISLRDACDVVSEVRAAERAEEFELEQTALIEEAKTHGSVDES